MKICRKKNKLFLELELEEPRLSQSGKTNILFSSGGFTSFEDMGISVNVIAKKRK